MNFFNLPTDIAEEGGAELPDYVTTVADQGRTHTVHSIDLSDKAYQAHLGELGPLLKHSGRRGDQLPPLLTRRSATKRRTLLIASAEHLHGDLDGNPICRMYAAAHLLFPFLTGLVDGRPG